MLIWLDVTSLAELGVEQPILRSQQEHLAEAGQKWRAMKLRIVSHAAATSLKKKTTQNIV